MIIENDNEADVNDGELNQTEAANKMVGRIPSKQTTLNSTDALVSAS